MLCEFVWVRSALEARGSREVPLLHSHSSDCSEEFTKPVPYLPASETDKDAVVEAQARLVGLSRLMVGLFR